MASHQQDHIFIVKYFFKVKKQKKKTKKRLKIHLKLKQNKLVENLIFFFFLKKAKSEIQRRSSRI